MYNSSPFINTVHLENTNHDFCVNINPQIIDVALKTSMQIIFVLIVKDDIWKNSVNGTHFMLFIYTKNSFLFQCYIK